MSRNKVILASVFLVCLIGLLLWMQGAFRSKVPGGTTAASHESKPLPPTMKVQATQTRGEVTVPGGVVARDAAQLAARVSGHVLELLVEPGALVKAGQLLVRLDTKELEEKVAQASAALESAKADLANAKSDFDRYSALLETQSIARKEFDQAKNRYETTQAAESRAKSALDEARTMLSYGFIKSPIDGIVSDKSVNAGDLATPGRNLLTLYSPESLELVASAGEQYAPYLKEQDPVIAAIPSLGIRQSSHIREVVPQRDQATRTITVKVPLTRESGLRPGIYGALTFNTQASAVVQIPETAVTTVGQLESVRVVQDGSVKLRYVKTGKKLADGTVEILSGLSPGEEIVAQRQAVP